MQEIKGFVFDAGPVLKELLNPEVRVILQGFPQGILEFFVDHLCGLLGSGGFNLAPSADDGSARLALDDKGFARIVWNPEVVTAALAAAKRYGYVLAVHERLTFSVEAPDTITEKQP